MKKQTVEEYKKEQREKTKTFLEAFTYSFHGILATTIGILSFIMVGALLGYAHGLDTELTAKGGKFALIIFLAGVYSCAYGLENWFSLFQMDKEGAKK